MDFVDSLMALPEPEKPEGLVRFDVVAPNTRDDDNLYAEDYTEVGPSESDDLERVVNLPRRDVPEPDKQAMVILMGRRLRRERAADDPCRCESEFGRKCILELKPAQAWALYELSLKGGLLGPIGVGQGKTALNILAPMVVPNCKQVVLMVPPGLVDQIRTEYLLWREHWKVPSLLIKKSGWIVPGAPALHVVPYSRLSRAEAALLLEDLKPDLIITDEADKLRNATAARTMRLVRYFEAHPETRLAAWSGSLCDKSIKDYAHLAKYALGVQSPLPVDPVEQDMWAAAIDPPMPGCAPAPMGSLVQLCKPGETLWKGFNRRLLETRGVVATQDPGIRSRLVMSKRDPGSMPEVVADALRTTRETWVRPDGEELTDAMSVARACREIACGFFYRWIFPNGEPVSLIMDWLECRAAWNKEVRQELKKAKPLLDSPLLLSQAAERALDPDYDGNAPTWESMHWESWRDIKGEVKPETEAIWLDEYLVNDAAEWGRKNNGVIWYQHNAWGTKLAEVSGFPRYGGGQDAARKILEERGDRSIIASINSHGRGRNGLQFHFTKQLVANPPESKHTGGASKWEQLLGRLHREGQTETVYSETYRHTRELRESWDRAQYLARFVNESMGSFQKLLYCDVTWGDEHF
jgi:hypothetical protein